MPATISIHFQSPPEDPLKLPRPLHLSVDFTTGAVLSARGGELGSTNLVGLSVAPVPLGNDFDNPARWADERSLIRHMLGMLIPADREGTVATTDHFNGWYPSVVEGEGIVSVNMPVSRVEVRPS